MNNLKTITQLKDGDCKVVARSGSHTKEFKGIYDSKLKVVFMAVSSHYEVIGYKQ